MSAVQRSLRSVPAVVLAMAITVASPPLPGAQKASPPPQSQPALDDLWERLRREDPGVYEKLRAVAASDSASAERFLRSRYGTGDGKGPAGKDGPPKSSADPGATPAAKGTTGKAGAPGGAAGKPSLEGVPLHTVRSFDFESGLPPGWSAGEGVAAAPGIGVGGSAALAYRAPSRPAIPDPPPAEGWDFEAWRRVREERDHARASGRPITVLETEAFPSQPGRAYRVAAWIEASGVRDLVAQVVEGGEPGAPLGAESVAAVKGAAHSGSWEGTPFTAAFRARGSSFRVRFSCVPAEAGGEHFTLDDFRVEGEE
ncbi:MAG TPA: hypothetical protein VFI25_01745 [Planctomycetota bacterium]|jgi:hypothetical protein|nr:hypothetical protein [Planctomycetota bacterium]